MLFLLDIISIKNNNKKNISNLLFITHANLYFISY